MVLAHQAISHVIDSLDSAKITMEVTPTLSLSRKMDATIYPFDRVLSCRTSENVGAMDSVSESTQESPPSYSVQISLPNLILPPSILLHIPQKPKSLWHTLIIFRDTS
jgi:hypothetical protein